MERRLIILLLFLSVNLYGGVLPRNVWYVQPITGEYGTEDGTSLATAFDGFTGINWTVIQPNDYLYIVGNFAETLTVGKSGTVTKPIYIKGYNGYASINGGGSLESCIVVTNYNYINIQDIYLTSPTTNGLLISGTSNNINVFRVVSERSGNQSYQHLNTASANYYDCQGNHSTDDGMSLHDTTSVVAYDCSYYGNSDGFGAIASAKLTGYNCYISKNTNTDMACTAATSDSTACVKLYYSLIEQTTGLIDIDNKGSAEIWYTKINTSSTGHVIDVGGVGAANKGYLKINYSIINNIANVKDGIVVRTTSVVNSKNNVFYGSGTRKGYGVGIVSGGYYYTYNSIYSNLAKGLYILTGGIASTTNDCYYNNLDNITGTATALNDTVASNPNFASAGTDFSITSGSSCINTGANLGATYQFGLKNNSVWTNSINLLNQNSFGNWEIGAYIYEP